MMIDELGPLLCQTWGQLNTGIAGQFKIGITYLKKGELEMISLDLEFAKKTFNPPINFLTQKYFFHDNLSWNINNLGVGIPSRYSE